MTLQQTIGIVGGSGQLGGAIARGLLRSGCIAPEQMFISNRSGDRSGFGEWPGVTVTTRNQDLADRCKVILLSVPPHLASMLEIDTGDKLVLSVMAGVTIDRIAEATGARRIVRAMSNPAADLGLAYSPWCAAGAVTDNDRRIVSAIFGACGLTDEVPDEEQIDRFTALTGPVPGFVAFFAECMVAYAEKHGVEPTVADRAIRQLFRASGTIMAEDTATPGEHVAAMIAYAGTTAAGLEAMKASPLAMAIEAGLDAAFDKARTIA